MKDKKYAAIMGVSVLLFVMGCGSDSTNTKTGLTASLTPVNEKANPDVFGVAKVKTEEDRFDVSVSLAKAGEGVHAQGLYTGMKCPGPDADKNADGYIDAVEAQAVSGKFLIPLDGDLSAQLEGQDGYPVDDYDYSETAALSRMISDLIIKDPNPDDSIVKLTSPEQLNIEGKVIIVHGVPAETILPATVQTVDGLTPQASLPIACGQLESKPSSEASTN